MCCINTLIISCPNILISKFGNFIPERNGLLWDVVIWASSFPFRLWQTQLLYIVLLSSNETKYHLSWLTNHYLRYHAAFSLPLSLPQWWVPFHNPLCFRHPTQSLVKRLVWSGQNENRQSKDWTNQSSNFYGCHCIHSNDYYICIASTHAH
jgi:hypothetical protein